MAAEAAGSGGGSPSSARRRLRIISGHLRGSGRAALSPSPCKAQGGPAGPAAGSIPKKRWVRAASRGLPAAGGAGPAEEGRDPGRALRRPQGPGEPGKGGPVLRPSERGVRGQGGLCGRRAGGGALCARLGDPGSLHLTGVLPVCAGPARRFGCKRVVGRSFCSLWHLGAEHLSSRESEGGRMAQQTAQLSSCELSC